MGEGGGAVLETHKGVQGKKEKYTSAEFKLCRKVSMSRVRPGESGERLKARSAKLVLTEFCRAAGCRVAGGPGGGKSVKFSGSSLT